jgi:predicted ATPase
VAITDTTLLWILAVGSALVVAIASLIVIVRRRRAEKGELESLRRSLDEARSKLSQTTVQTEAQPGSADAGSAAPAAGLYLEKIELRNIRCFSHLTISLKSSDGVHMRALMLGDNASGKSTVLRAIALALCNESDAITLMTTWPGSLIRTGQTSASIRVSLRGRAGNETYQIEKTIERTTDGSEILRHKSETPPEILQRSVFVCGYGTQRTRAASLSVESYSPRQAVSTLFDEAAALQNPEVVFLRQSSSLRAILQQKLLDVMLLDADKSGIEATSAGINLKGPWGSVPLRTLSDGYRSTMQWLMDLFSWLVHARRLRAADEPEGIVLVDEIEQHLHPRWQRYVIQRLSEQLPRMQFIATTHTPLVASGLADVDASTIIKLKRIEEDRIVTTAIDPSELRGKRADQVLTELFELTTSRNPGSSEELARLVKLRSQTSRSKDEETELAALAARLEPAMTFGETEFERKVDEAVTKTLDTLLTQRPDKAFGPEVKRQVQELFREDKVEK